MLKKIEFLRTRKRVDQLRRILFAESPQNAQKHVQRLAADPEVIVPQQTQHVGDEHRVGRFFCSPGCRVFAAVRFYCFFAEVKGKI